MGPMMIRNLILNSQSDSDEICCIHCGVEKKEAGEGICYNNSL